MRRNLAILTGLFAAVFGLTACPGKPHKNQARTVVFVKGDPRNIYEGAKTNSDFDLNFFNSPVVNLVSLLEFTEKETTVISRAVDPERQNAASKESKGSPSLTFNVSVDQNNGSVEFQMPKSKVRLRLIKRAGLAPNVEMEARGEKQTAELVHFSVSEDKNFFSLLLYQEVSKNEGRIVTKVVFAKALTSIKPSKIQSEQKFFYIQGPNVKTAWPKNKPVKFSICGKANNYAPEIKAAVGRWQKALGERLSLNVVQERTYYPFSDLQQNCILFIPQYLREVQETYAEAGGTVYSVDPNTFQFLSSDIMIWESELAKYRDVGGYTDEMIHDELKFIFTHEYGHALGLDHQFDGRQSVMSYRHRRPELSDYDIRAIRALYE